MDHILTLLCDPGKAILTPEIAERARSALAGAVGDIDWLADRVACEAPFAGMSPRAATAAARRALDGYPVDVVAQPRAGRRKRLLVADMDSTIITVETVDELAALAGVGDKVANCVLLFSLDKLDAFPIDVWIERVLHEWYLDGRKMSRTNMRLWARDYFGAYAGYANHYLFHDRRQRRRRRIDGP